MSRSTQTDPRRNADPDVDRLRALDYHRNNAHSQRVLDAMQADSAVRLALDKMAPETKKRHKGDLMKLFAADSNPRCVEAVRPVDRGRV
ncbi:hypothetical protein C7H84_33990 [Burkholderia sp. Nafp2/4-1b]|nr:hypothetical protein C7H84_33990 [Burkholderia sp. Nafp2/4-1b]